MAAYMYILECNDKTYYAGSTTNLDIRLKEHQKGTGAEYTKHRLPVKLVYFEECLSIEDAFLREKQIQGWGRKKREALIKGEFEEIKKLSKKRFETK